MDDRNRDLCLLRSLDQTLRLARAKLGADITVQRLLILIGVFLHEGLSQNELLRLLDSTSTTALSRNLAELSGWTSRKTKGLDLIVLRSDPLNLRRKQVYLTGKGKRFLKTWISHINKSTELVTPPE